MNQPVLNQNAPLILYHGRGRPEMTDIAHDTEPGISASLGAGSLITIKEIREIFGLGRTAAYELTHRPGFPAPVPISRCAIPADHRRSADRPQQEGKARSVAGDAK